MQISYKLCYFMLLFKAAFVKFTKQTTNSYHRHWTNNDCKMMEYEITSSVFYLEDSQNSLVESIKVCSWFYLILVEVKLATKELHSEECKDDDEKKEQ